MSGFDMAKERVLDHCAVAGVLSEDEKALRAVSDMAGMILDVIKKGGRMLICGNGGSAADAQHIAAELMGKFKAERRALDAEALTVNSSVLTAVSNDYDYDMVFARQVEGRGRKGDVLLGISTSGNSENIIKALKKAKDMGMIALGFAGDGHCGMDDICDEVFHAPSSDTPRIQEMHILAGHIICEIVVAGIK